MRVYTPETLAPLTRLCRKVRSADFPKYKQGAMGFGI
jgi:hypothetical protein